jgi:DNA polymerase-3 subunit delta'
MWAQVLPTIRSRCICQVLSDPDLAAKIAWLEQAQVSYPKRWLELASGKIDTALAMAQDPLWLPLLKLVPELLQDEQIDSLGLAQQMSKAELKRVVYVLILLMHDLLAVSQAAPAKFFAVYTDTMRNKVSKLKVEAVNHYLQRLTAMARIVEHPLNARVQCEALLVDYKNCFFSISSIK